MSQCYWQSSEMPQRQCKWPGVFSSSLHGDHKWKCYWHNKISGEGKSTMQLDGNEIVRQSYEWDGSPESYLALRTAHASIPKAAQAGNDREDQGKPEVRVGATTIPRRVSELVADLQPEYDREF